MCSGVKQVRKELVCCGFPRLFLFWNDSKVLLLLFFEMLKRDASNHFLTWRICHNGCKAWTLGIPIKIPTKCSKYQQTLSKYQFSWYYDHWYFDRWYFDTVLVAWWVPKGGVAMTGAWLNPPPHPQSCHKVRKYDSEPESQREPDNEPEWARENQS